MEIGLLILVFVLFVLVIFLLIKNYVLKRDVESMVVKLDANLDKLIAGKKVDNSDNDDDLYSKIAQKLYRLYNINEQKSNEIIEEKEKLNELISDISHQTKTPIANIKLYFEILMSENDVEKRQACLKNIESQIDKLDFLIQSLIKMSRLETGTIKINKEPSLLENTLALAIQGIYNNANQKKIKLQVNCPDDLVLNHDKKWTGEAIFNILDNGVKYTNNGGSIYIDVKKQDIFTKITVCDTGKGIPLARQGMIFKRFYREPEVHDENGVGIGLYLARKIISLQGGYIEVQSEVGIGSTFMIYLPN